MQQINKICCEEKTKGKGILSGLAYGLIPHSFCIAYLIFSVLGITAGVAFFRSFFLIPYFFQTLIILSFIFATISAAIYLKRNNILSLYGIKRKWRYLSVLYGSVISVNLLLFFVIFPAMANFNTTKASVLTTGDYQSVLILKAEIPCSGHAPLIIDELKKIEGVGEISFETPNLFYIKYDSSKTSPIEIKSLEIFKEFKAVSI